MTEEELKKAQEELELKKLDIAKKEAELIEKEKKQQEQINSIIKTKNDKYKEKEKTLEDRISELETDKLENQLAVKLANDALLIKSKENFENLLSMKINPSYLDDAKALLNRSIPDISKVSKEDIEKAISELLKKFPNLEKNINNSSKNLNEINVNQDKDKDKEKVIIKPENYKVRNKQSKIEYMIPKIEFDSWPAINKNNFEIIT